MLKRVFLLALALLTGCRTKPPAAPTEPGTSLPLKFPVVLMGQGRLDVREDMPTLTSATVASGMNFFERKILDSTGASFEIKQDTVVGPTVAWWRDLGTSQQRHFLELKKNRSSSLEAAKQLVLEEVRSPRGSNGDPKAVARVQGFASIAELIEGCRMSWDWNSLRTSSREDSDK